MSEHVSERVLVTGGAGFVGRALVNALIARGDEVLVLDLDPSGIHDKGVSILTGSITDPDCARRACDGIDTVYHLAGNAQLWARDEAIFDQVNHIGTKVMLEAARHAGVSHFIHCSSLTTLVGKNTPIGPSTADETIFLPPDAMLGAYPRSKNLAEQAVLAEASNLGKASELPMKVMVAIPTEPLGAGDDSITPPTRMILDFINGKTPAYINCILNFVPVSDLAKGFIAVREKGQHGERYVLGGENVPMRQLLERLETLGERKMPALCMPYQVALLAGIVDTKLVAPVTGNQPKAPLTGVRLAGRQVTFSSEKAKRELKWCADDSHSALKSLLGWARERSLIV